MEPSGHSRETAPRLALMESPTAKLDATEVRIILELQRDGRMPTKEIARRIGTSEVTVRRRLQRMRNGGLLQIAAAVDPFALGYETVAEINLKVDPVRLEAIAMGLTEHPQVRFVAATLGSWDLSVEYVSAGTQGLADFLTNELAQIDGIREVDTTLILKVFLQRGMRGLGESHLRRATS